MNKKYSLTVVTFFILMLFAVPFSIFLSADRDYSENENRYLAQMPPFHMDKLLSGEFTKDVEQYIDDQFPFREAWISSKSDIVQFAGNKEINGAYLCEDGFLIEKWLKQDFDPAKLQANIDAVNQFSKDHPNQKTGVMVIPTAGLILNDKLPTNAPMFDQNIAFNQIKKNLSVDCFIDTRETLNSHKNEYIFYKTDHHWTTYGAFLGYQKWCEEHNLLISKDDFQIEYVTNSFRGSLYSKVLNRNCVFDSIEKYLFKRQSGYTVVYNSGKDQSNSVYDLDQLNKKDKYQFFLGGNHPELTIKTNHQDGKHLLIIKDSFANAFIPFLLNNYESIHVIDPRYFKGDIEQYISKNHITEFLFLYNIKNFCEEKTLSNFA